MRYRCEILNHGIDGYEVWLHGRNQGRSGVKQSSAKSLTLEDTIDGRSFMCKRKSIGPKTVPCGTPESTSTRPDDTPSTTTHCLRFF